MASYAFARHVVPSVFGFEKSRLPSYHFFRIVRYRAKCDALYLGEASTFFTVPELDNCIAYFNLVLYLHKHTMKLGIKVCGIYLCGETEIDV